MKNILILVSYALAVLLITNCQENVSSNTETHEQSNLKIIIPDFYPPEIVEASVDNEMSLNAREIRYFALDSIISTLESEDELLNYIRLLFDNHNQFTNEKINIIKSIENGIIEKANNTRFLIMNNLNNGTISLAQAEKEIELLNGNVRKTLEDNKVYKLTLREIIFNRKLVLNAIASHLNSIQLKKWNDFIRQHSYIFYGEPL